MAGYEWKRDYGKGGGIYEVECLNGQRQGWMGQTDSLGLWWWEGQNYHDSRSFEVLSEISIKGGSYV
jgi:hypothetical protein